MDAVVLDLRLPYLDGLNLCRRLREGAGADTAVRMLTARDTLDDKLAGFEARPAEPTSSRFAVPADPRDSGIWPGSRPAVAPERRSAPHKPGVIRATGRLGA